MTVREAMKQQFGLIQRPWGVYYLKNKLTGEQTSLKTPDRAEAERLLLPAGHSRKGIPEQTPGPRTFHIAEGQPTRATPNSNVEAALRFKASPR